MRGVIQAARLLLISAAVSCMPAPERATLPENCFAFGVFGDGPYRAWEMGRFRRVIDDVNAQELHALVHVGDFTWYPCSDAEFVRRLSAMNQFRPPVIYTPGDNEWADCHERIAGGYQPLERLSRLRELFFPRPHESLGRRTLRLATQADSPGYSEFVENARWEFGGFVFVTVHLVGANNATEAFAGRTQADNDAVAKRTAAAMAWLDAAFAAAQLNGRLGVIIATHASPWEWKEDAVRKGFEPFVAHLAALVTGFSGQVLLVHGDMHTQHVDQPLRDTETGETLTNFTRMETFGSPKIGWVRVVVDSVAGRVVAFEPRLMPNKFIW